MADVNYIFILSFIIIAIGFLLKKLNIITEENGKVIAKLILNVTLPALILNVISNIEIDPTLLILPLICLIFSIVVILFSFILFRNYPNELKGLILMCIIGFNIGLFAYPIIEAIYGETGLIYIAMFDVGNAFIIFGLCYIIGSIFSPKDNNLAIKDRYKMVGSRLIKSAPLMAYIIAIIINVSGIQFPMLVSDILNILAMANMALTLLLLGIYLNFKFEKEQWINVIKLLIIRYSFGLIVGIILFIFLPFNLLYRSIILIGLILPIGMAVIPFAVEFEYNEKLAGMMVNLSIIISFILMWIIIIFIGLD